MAAVVALLVRVDVVLVRDAPPNGAFEAVVERAVPAVFFVAVVFGALLLVALLLVAALLVAAAEVVLVAVAFFEAAPVVLLAVVLLGVGLFVPPAALLVVTAPDLFTVLLFVAAPAVFVVAAPAVPFAVLLFVPARVLFAVLLFVPAPVLFAVLLFVPAPAFFFVGVPLAAAGRAAFFAAAASAVDARVVALPGPSVVLARAAGVCRRAELGAGVLLAAMGCGPSGRRYLVYGLGEDKPPSCGLQKRLAAWDGMRLPGRMGGRGNPTNRRPAN